MILQNQPYLFETVLQNQVEERRRVYWERMVKHARRERQEAQRSQRRNRRGLSPIQPVAVMR
jgi:hypothetical protein